MLKSLSPWYFVTAAQENKHINQQEPSIMTLGNHCGSLSLPSFLTASSKASSRQPEPPFGGMHEGSAPWGGMTGAKTREVVIPLGLNVSTVHSSAWVECPPNLSFLSCSRTHLLLSLPAHLCCGVLERTIPLSPGRAPGSAKQGCLAWRRDHRESSWQLPRLGKGFCKVLS